MIRNKILSFICLWFLVFSIFPTSNTLIKEVSADDKYISTMVVNLIWDMTWIEPEIQSKEREWSPNPFPTDYARKIYIKSKKEILSARDTLRNKDLTIKEQD